MLDNQISGSMLVDFGVMIRSGSEEESVSILEEMENKGIIEEQPEGAGLPSSAIEIPIYDGHDFFVTHGYPPEISGSHRTDFEKNLHIYWRIETQDLSPFDLKKLGQMGEFVDDLDSQNVEFQLYGQRVE